MCCIYIYWWAYVVRLVYKVIKVTKDFDLFFESWHEVHDGMDVSWNLVCERMCELILGDLTVLPRWESTITFKLVYHPWVLHVCIMECLCINRVPSL